MSVGRLTLHHLFGSNFWCPETGETVYTSQIMSMVVASLDSNFGEPEQMESATSPEDAAIALLQRVHGATEVVVY